MTMNTLWTPKPLFGMFLMTLQLCSRRRATCVWPQLAFLCRLNVVVGLVSSGWFFLVLGLVHGLCAVSQNLTPPTPPSYNSSTPQSTFHTQCSSSPENTTFFYTSQPSHLHLQLNGNARHFIFCNMHQVQVFQQKLSFLRLTLSRIFIGLMLPQD